MTRLEMSLRKKRNGSGPQPIRAQSREPNLISPFLPARSLASGTVGSSQGWTGRAAPELQVLPAPQSFLSHFFPLRLVAMTKLSAQVKSSLNITTPGVQIWRIEVRSAWVWGGEEDRGKKRPGIMLTILQALPAGWRPWFQSPSVPPLSSGIGLFPCPFTSSPPHIPSPHQLCHALLLPALCLSQLLCLRVEEAGVLSGPGQPL